MGSLVSIAAVFFLCAAARTSAAENSGTTARLSVAAAANFVYALEELRAEFQRTEPGTVVTVSTGASGSLVAQIKQHAPFDVFLSADREFAEALVQRDSADRATLTPFATGRLVLWTLRADVPTDDIAALVRNASVRKIAIGNVDATPYGRAARATLQHLGAWKAAEPKLVIGENITQAAQFVSTGNADAGFVALSLVLSPRLKERGHWTLVPPSLHRPLEHVAVITRHGEGNAAARRFVLFLRSAPARAVFERYGYGPPPGPDR